jgi:hypothetical protein
MKRCFAVIASFALLACGCQSANNKAGEGTVVGGVLGAGAGAIIGNQSHHAAGGALIGGALGALGGALVGSNVPKNQQPQAQAGYEPQPGYQSPYSQQISIDEIVTLTGQGASDEIIIDRIKATNSRFTLTEAQIASLKSKGVSQAVINAMRGL